MTKNDARDWESKEIRKGKTPAWQIQNEKKRNMCTFDENDGWHPRDC